LLDEGHAIPFIARFRKDLTGGLDAEHLSAIKQRVTELRALAERKSFILKSIESQGKLTDKLAADINKATNSRRVEDLYLPFKAKKQALAATARQQGLEPLANEIFEGQRPDVDLPTRAIEFVRVDKGLNSVDEVISGVQHLIAERISERSDLRRELRRTVWGSGELTCRVLQPKEEEGGDTEPDATSPEMEASVESIEGENPTPDTNASAPELAADTSTDVVEDRAENAESVADPVVEQSQSSPEAVTESTADASPTTAEFAESSQPDASVTVDSDSAQTPATAEPVAAELPPKKRKRRKKKAKRTPHPFADYENFSESVKKIPHHRVLAINRGERGGNLKVKLRVDADKIERIATTQVVRTDHPFAAFMEECTRDALHRLVMPSLEREVRRELTDSAERHAIKVFAHNLKGLLLRPPVRGQRIMAIDPGYKNGCAVAVLDSNGRLIATDKISIVGNEQRRTENRQKLASLAQEHDTHLFAIGNGTACREAEKLVSDAIANELAGFGAKYLIVNEAGASTYSTSEIGKEELPDLMPQARSAVSIGRRVLDPLSELVKISPGHLGVGLYQHDIKARHLAESLDEVVESCVNFVGVNTATASPALLRYVAGLNQLTARRLVEFRQERPITTRQDLKEVPGIGDATFVQSAGFLRVYGGEVPFDETAIHPESYEIATAILSRLELDPQTWLRSRRGTLNPNAQTVSPNAKAETSPVTDVENEVAEETPNEVIDANDLPAPADSSATDAAAAAEPSQTEPLKSSPEILAALDGLNSSELAREFEVGELMMRDIIEALKRPTHDPRQDGNEPVFREGIIKIEDLAPEMELMSQVLNVVDFGLFVDVGLGYSCLVHVSELSTGFVKDLYELYAVGDSLVTWVKEVDVARRRVKLTAIRPGTPKEPKHSRPRRDRSRKRDDQAGTPQKSGENVAVERTAHPPRENRVRGPHRPKRDFSRKRVERKAKPKPVAPITKEMLSGDKPMRSFSDLAQFFTKKRDEK
jgi:uncharacterized protein